MVYTVESDAQITRQNGEIILKIKFPETLKFHISAIAPKGNISFDLAKSGFSSELTLFAT